MMSLYSPGAELRHAASCCETIDERVSTPCPELMLPSGLELQCPVQVQSEPVHSSELYVLPPLAKSHGETHAVVDGSVESPPTHPNPASTLTPVPHGE